MDILGLFSNFFKVIVFKNRLDRAKFYLDPEPMAFWNVRITYTRNFLLTLCAAVCTAVKLAIKKGWTSRLN